MSKMWLLIWMLLSVGLIASLSPTQAEDLSDAQKLFKMQCKRCHGADGQGNHKMLKFLKLQERGIKALNLLKDEAKKMKDEEITKIILEGKGEKMKPFKEKIRAEQAIQLTKLIRKLQLAPQ
jgi:mono/diheme cytochrome c family protein